MTPLRTPPPVSTLPQAAPPALKQQNQRIITDESDDEKINNSTPVTFPLLMSQRKLMPNVAPRPVVTTAPSHEYHPPPSISLQPQSRDFMKFPLCKRVHSRDVTLSQTSVVTHSIPIRPPEQQCFRGRSPSLQLMIDDEFNEGPSEITESSNKVHHAKTPCHLARRGAEERTYLESQLRAEENIRKKHHWENEERKAREERLTIQDDENDAHNDEISALMEKFTDFELDSTEMSLSECARKWVPVQQNKKLRNIAPSPPIILQKTFKRSVSAVIADSRGEDDEDACVLFFPDGLPLVDECYNEGTTSIKSHTILENCNSFDLDSKCTSPQTHDVTEGSTPQFTISCHSSPESVECQPVLAGGELEIVAAGQNLRGSFNKKVTLRPKMAVRPKTPAKMKQNDHSGREADFQAIPDLPDQIDLYSRLFDVFSEDVGSSALPDLDESLLSLEAADKQGNERYEETISGPTRTFKRLDSDATIVRKNGEFSDELTNVNSLDSGQTQTHIHIQDWNYSSPEPIRRSQFQVNDSMLPPPPPPPLNQETTPIEPFQLKLREPLSESNYCTPDHSNVTTKKQLGLRPSGLLDPLPELILPSFKKKPKPASFHEDLPETQKL